MHFLATQTRILDEAASAVDLGQSAGDVVVLSFTDSDLAVLAQAQAANADLPQLRLANIARLQHPYSVDLYLEKTCAGARFVLVRLLGGVDYWRYGVEELAAAARANRFHLAFVPGDYREDARMDAASTLDVPTLRELWGYFQEGGPDNMGRLLGWIAARLNGAGSVEPPLRIAPFGRFEPACLPAPAHAGMALLVFYRSVLMAGDTLPILALAKALHQRGLGIIAVFVTSLKDPVASAGLAALIGEHSPDVILNTTAFSGRDGDACVLDSANAPVLQVILAGCSQETWESNTRGLGAADIAMNLVLPEIDGRLISRAISFKAEAPRDEAMQFTCLYHQPKASRVNYVADLAANWARLRRRAPAARRIACILSDYPGRGGRSGYAVGLDTPASVTAIARALRGAGYAVAKMPGPARLMRMLTAAKCKQGPALAHYCQWFAALPAAFQASVVQHWGAPEADAAVRQGAFWFRYVRAGNLTVALQPGRGGGAVDRNAYHDTNRPPCHAYIAFYLWLRHCGLDAMVHAGTHGTLEWLPGKAAALSAECAPEILLGAVPVVYPFIVNNPGEASAAKRRLAAIALGHMTPPLTQAGAHGAGLELEALLDEYADARSMDPRRARHLASAILVRARDTGLLADSGIANDAEPEAALAALDAYLCDCKEMRIRDGLHVFGRNVPRAQIAEMTRMLAGADVPGRARTRMIQQSLAASAKAERSSLLHALDGRFVQPGPGGAPSRGRLDVLPTGRNLFSVDPRQVPTQAAYDIGQRLAGEIMDRHAQDHGEWPRTLVMDLWGSATMRTGGDEIAQALALMGVRPVWDHASARVSGVEIVPQARLERPRVDVTLRISGLFRDVFATQIVLLDQAVQAVAELEEDDDFNPLAQARRASVKDQARIFGSAPGTYGAGLGGMLAGNLPGGAEAGAAYLNATSHAYGGAQANGTPDAAGFRARVAVADAFVHVQDMGEQDVLDSIAFAEHEGGFYAAAKLLGNQPAMYHADSSAAGAVKIRTLQQEVARVLQARASNPRWIAGQMRHGYRGAAEIAETVDNLFAYAALTDVVQSRHFDKLFDAYCDVDIVRNFLIAANPQAAAAIAARLAEAQKRGYWTSRRNSVAARLAEMAGAA